MGKFGTGCCTGGYKFAGNPGWKPPTRKAQAPEDIPPCNPDSVPDFNDISFGTTGLDWPKWMIEVGCGTIAILTQNEKTFDLTGILTPENAEAFADCVDDCLKRAGISKPPGGGVRDGIHKDERTCMLECKEDFMADQYEITVDLSAFIPSANTWADPPYSASAYSGSYELTGSLSGCPPMCVSSQVTLSFRGAVRCWARELPIHKLQKYPGWSWVPYIDIYHHAVSCEVISCPPLTKLCFRCEDRHPQNPMVYDICMEPDGKVVSYDMVSGNTAVGPEGSCARKMRNPSYRGPPNRPDSCCEHYFGMYKFIIHGINMEVPCP